MPAPEFRFGITLGGAPDNEVTHVMVDVFRSVLAHVGLKGSAADPLLDELMAARRAAPSGECTLRFTAHADELEIAFSRGGRDWRTSCPIPVR